MAREKFQPTLVQKVRMNQAFRENQERLKRKHGIKSNVIIVEKANTIKFLVKMCFATIRVCATAILLGLAFIGLAAIIYPAPRQELVTLFYRLLELLRTYLQG